METEKPNDETVNVLDDGEPDEEEEEEEATADTSLDLSQNNNDEPERPAKKGGTKGAGRKVRLLKQKVTNQQLLDHEQRTEGFIMKGSVEGVNNVFTVCFATVNSLKIDSNISLMKRAFNQELGMFLCVVCVFAYFFFFFFARVLDICSTHY